MEFEAQGRRVAYSHIHGNTTTWSWSLGDRSGINSKRFEIK